MIEFSTAQNLNLLIIIPLFVVFFVWRWVARQNALNRIGDPALIARLTQRVHYRRRVYRIILWLLTVGTVIIGLARPTWGETLERVETNQRQIIIALDISRSMNAQDIMPSRLERAIFDIRQLLQAVRGDDVGIVIFTNEAYRYVPLTYDLYAVEIYLQALTTEAITQQGTSLQRALETAQIAFEARSGAERIIVLMTDGESHEGDALDIAQGIRDEGITLHVGAYGTDSGAVIPIYQNGELIDYKTDTNGILVETRVNTPLLRAIADIGQGEFQHINNNEASIRPIIDGILASEQGIGRDYILRIPTERFTWFIALALIFLTLEMFTGDMRQAI